MDKLKPSQNAAPSPHLTTSEDGGTVDAATNSLSQEGLRLALQTCRVGMWEWDLATNEVRWSPELEAIHGLAPGTFQGSFSAFQQDIHPEDRPRVLAAIERTVEQRTDYQVEYRILWPDGSLHWVEGRGKLFPEHGGNPALMIGMCMDITKRKGAEEALRESEQRFSRFMQHLPGLAWIKDLEGRYVFANDAAESAFQTPCEKLYGKKDEDLFPREVAAQFQEHDFRALETGTGIQVIETLQHADGVIHHSIVSKFPISGSNGRPMFIGGMAIDITDQKRVEKALRERDEQYELIVTGAEAAIWDWNVADKRVYFSSRWKEMRGLSDDEVSDREEEWSSRIHPDDFARVMAALQAHFEGRSEVFNEEYRVRHNDGHWIWIADRGISKRNEAGKVVRMVGSETDITLRKQAEQALQESEKEARRLLELNQIIMINMGEGLYTLDSEGLVTYLNPEAERLFGWERGELLGRRMHEVTHYKHPDGSPFLIEECAGLQVLREGHILRDFEDTFIRKDGSFFPVSFSSSPLRDQNGKIAGLVIVFQDITERKRGEEELRRLKEELEVRVQDRTRELLASQGRLRSLASQLSLAEEHERRKLASSLHDYLAQLLVVGRMKLDQAKTLVSLTPEAGDVIQDLENILQQALTYSRTTIAELSPPTLHGAGLPLAFIWLSERMQQHGLQVEVQTNGKQAHLPDDLAILLFQSVRELLFNVLKHAGVDRARICLAGGPDGAVEVSVEDHGKGLDADAMQRALEPGHLGLFAVRERMEAVGGSVELNSVSGHGTRVTLLLPVCGTNSLDTEKNQPEDDNLEQPTLQEQVSLEAQPEAELPHPIRVLVVEDHDMTRKGLLKLLKKYDDLEIVGEAGDGVEAVALAEHLMPDVIIMDVNMPKLNGIEATRQIIRTSPAKKIIGLSFHDGKEIRAAMFEAGAVDYLTKNGSVKDLYHAICAACSKG